MGAFNDILDYFQDTRIQVQIGSANYYCNRVNPLDGEVLYTDAGRVEGVAFALVFKVADFATIPKQDTFITVNGMEYRVGKITVDSQGVTFKTSMVARYN